MRLIQKILMVLLSFSLVTPAAAQIDAAARGLAIQANSTIAGLRAGQPWETYLNTEGYQATNSATYGTNSSAAFSIGQALGGYKAPPGHALWVESITCSSTLPVIIWVQRTNSSLIANGATSVISPLMPTSGNTARVEVNELIPEGETISYVLRTAVAQAANASAPDWTWSCGFSGRLITNDFNASANKAWMAIGDSITNTTGPTYGRQFYHFLTRDWLISQNKNYRLILKGDGGWTAANAESLRLVGGMEPAQADLISYMLGTNDTALSTFQVSFPVTLAGLQKRFPKAQKVIIGPPPRQGSAETLLATIRSYEQSYVSSLGDPTVTYCSLGTAFSNADDTYYFTGDASTAGNRVHPNAAGQALMATTLQACLSANNVLTKL